MFYVDLGLGLRAFCLAVIGGAVITLMTWMQHGTESAGLELVPSVTGAFLLAAGRLNDAVVNSLLMYSALHTGPSPSATCSGSRPPRGLTGPAHPPTTVAS